MQDLQPTTIGIVVGMIGKLDTLCKIDPHPLHDPDRRSIRTDRNIDETNVFGMSWTCEVDGLKFDIRREPPPFRHRAVNRQAVGGKSRKFRHVEPDTAPTNA
ncbi:hypothetical protein DdX_21516 [Ditylenchus destructor]|uniref:Uncharacterized protein n=1 Tax=Ditylenchus destructor TaxID=166010 RepID=A0AAD4MES0_9BILA|nr:hypothetical protein DdX_21516 [Ditylenchus destructor]